jgi:signal transduction histidine kinase
LRGVRARLIVWNAVAIGLILATMALLLRAHLRQNAVLAVDSDLRAEAESARVASKSSGPFDSVLRLPVEPPFSRNLIGVGVSRQKTLATRMEDNSVEMITLEARGYLPRLIPVPLPALGGSQNKGPLDMESYREAATGVPSAADFESDGRPFRSNSVPVYVNGRVAAVVQAVRSMEPMEAMLQKFDTSLLQLLPIAILVAAGAGTVFVAGAMRPLRILTESAHALKPDERLPIVGQDEFAGLAVGFNTAFDRTSRAMAKQERALRQLERFTGDAGHELRTPLAVIKVSVSRMLAEKRLRLDQRRDLEVVDRAVDRMTKLIADLLLLARQDAGSVGVPRQRVHLLDTIEAALEAAPRDDRCPIELHVDSDLRVHGDAAMLERAIANLVANARSYARTRVTVETASDGERIDLTITDDGEGIAPDHLPRLGDRFYRPEASRSREQGGVGLGLAIAKGIVEAHGGEMEIRSEVGIGTTVLVRLPAA